MYQISLCYGHLTFLHCPNGFGTLLHKAADVVESVEWVHNFCAELYTYILDVVQNGVYFLTTACSC